MSERTYYRVGPDSPVMAAIRSAEKQQAAYHEAVKDLRKEYPGADIWTSGRSTVCGINFPGMPPDGWRHTKRGYSVPDKRNKAGRAIAERLSAMPKGIDGWEFARIIQGALKQDYTVWADDHVYFPLPEKFGDTWILSIEKRCKHAPPGCVLLKMSEYWTLREQERPE